MLIQVNILETKLVLFFLLVSLAAVICCGRLSLAISAGKNISDTY